MKPGEYDFLWTRHDVDYKLADLDLDRLAASRGVNPDQRRTHRRGGIVISNLLDLYIEESSDFQCYSNTLPKKRWQKVDNSSLIGNDDLVRQFARNAIRGGSACIVSGSSRAIDSFLELGYYDRIGKEFFMSDLGNTHNPLRNRKEIFATWKQLLEQWLLDEDSVVVTFSGDIEELYKIQRRCLYEQDDLVSHSG